MPTVQSIGLPFKERSLGSSMDKQDTDFLQLEQNATEWFSHRYCYELLKALLWPSCITGNELEDVIKLVSYKRSW